MNGDWIVSGGTLEASIGAALGSGSVTVNTSGIFVGNGGTAQTYANPVILAGGALGTRTGDLAVFAGTVNVTTDSNVNLKSNTTQANSQTITITGQNQL